MSVKLQTLLFVLTFSFLYVGNLVHAEGPPGNRAIGTVNDNRSKLPLEDATVSIRNRDKADDSNSDGVYYIVVPSDVNKFELVAKKEGYSVGYTDEYTNSSDPIEVDRIELDETDPSAKDIAKLVNRELLVLAEVASEKIKDLIFADLFRLTDKVPSDLNALIKEQISKLPGVEGPKVTWRLSLWGSRRPETEGLEYLTKRVLRRTKGKFRIDLFYGGTLSPAEENLDALMAGAFESAMFCSSYEPKRIVALSGLNLPFLPLRDIDVISRVHEAYFVQSAVAKEAQGHGVHLLAANPVPPYEFLGIGQPPKTVEAWKGKRIAAPHVIGQALAMIGAEHVKVSFIEARSLLEQGKLDAMAFSFIQEIEAHKFHEIAKWYTSNMAAGSIACPTVSNLNAWNKLPEQYRKLIEEAKADAYQESRSTLEEEAAKNLSLFKKKGLLEVRYSYQQLERLRLLGGTPLWEEWVSELEKMGIPGRNLLDLILSTAAEAQSR